MTAIRYALAASIALMGWGIDTIRAEMARWSKA